MPSVGWGVGRCWGERRWARGRVGGALRLEKPHSHSLVLPQTKAGRGGGVAIRLWLDLSLAPLRLHVDKGLGVGGATSR